MRPPRTESGHAAKSKSSSSRGFDISAPRSTMQLVYSTSHGTPNGNESITGEELLTQIQTVAAGLGSVPSRG